VHLKNPTPYAKDTSNGEGPLGNVPNMEGRCSLDGHVYLLSKKKIRTAFLSHLHHAPPTIPEDLRPQPPKHQMSQPRPVKMSMCARGLNTWSFCVRATASKATAPAEIKVFRKCKGANVSGHVKFQKRGHPFI